MKQNPPLLTSNAAKYAELRPLLERLCIKLIPPARPLLEIQADDLAEVAAEKARAAARSLGQPCFVDDAVLLLDAYPGFPGALTGSMLRVLGSAGFRRLLADQEPGARLVAHLACSDGEDCLQWRGELAGRVVPSETNGEGPGPLRRWFQPSVPGALSPMLHRVRAWQAMERDWGTLCAKGWTHPIEAKRRVYTVKPTGYSCVFCAELSGDLESIFAQLSKGSPVDRVVHCSTSFLLLPPLGQFIEGGLLLLTRAHVKCMAHLEAAQFAELDDLFAEVVGVLRNAYGCAPVIFEHGPGRERYKSTCCVDHAHCNIFPANVDLRSVLADFPGRTITSLNELSALRECSEDYIFVQHADGERTVHFSDVFPSQFLRRAITRQLGQPEHWHWRDYLGLEELRRTFSRLQRTFSAHVAI